MQELNLPQYIFKIKEERGKRYIFDQNRRKFVALTPEEWVRQNFTEYLVSEKKYPRSLIGIEVSLKVNRLDRRVDIVVYNAKGQAFMIVECKAPGVKITQSVFNQVANYNIPLKVKYLVVTNGIKHYCSLLDFDSSNFKFLEDIPNPDGLEEESIK